MQERFLQYSLKHGRSIRAVLLLEGTMAQKTLTVLSLQDGVATLRIGSRKKPVILPVSDILSCDYARGDHGDE